MTNASDPDPAPAGGPPFCVITVSDRSSRGERPDRSGPLLVEAFAEAGIATTAQVVPDGADAVEQAVRQAVAAGARAIITSGGTGIGPRDQTPEGTQRVLVRMLPGIAERLRALDAQAVPTSSLSRGVAGLTGDQPPVIVVNVAGSTGAARSAGPYLAQILPHAVAQLDGSDH